MNGNILGVDIGYDSLKLALCRDGRIKKAVLEPMPENLIKGSHVTSVETLGEVIRTAMKKSGIRASKAALVLPNDMCYVRTITMPPMNADQLAYNLPYEFNDYLVDELKNYTFDYAMLSDVRKDPTAPMELMAVAVNSAIIEEGREYLARAGLKMVKAAPVEYAYISIIREWQRTHARTGEYCVLDLGCRAIRMFMYSGDKHMVTRVLEIGMHSISSVIAEAMNVDEHLANSYLLTNYEDCQNQEYCVNAYNNIAVELMRALNFYRFSNRDSELSDIWLCGGGSDIPALRTALKETLGMAIHDLDELLPGGGNDFEGARDYAMAVAVTMD